MSHNVHLRQVGGSVMLTIPPTLLALLGVSVGEVVALAIEDGRLVVEPGRKPRYTLDDLIAQCEPVDEPASDEEQAWSREGRVGRELL